MTAKNPNEIVQEMNERAPLAVFSPYTHVQKQALERLRLKLKNCLPGESADGEIVWDSLQDYYDWFWFWVLGAYEVVRTMDEHRDCFDDAIKPEISSLKKELATIRMPFSKQELKGQSKSPNKFYNESSVCGVDPKRGALFVIGDERIWSEDMIKRTLKVLNTIKVNDIRPELPINRPKRVERD